MAFFSSRNLALLHRASKVQTGALFRNAEPELDKPKNTTRFPEIPDLALYGDLPDEEPGADVLPTISECAVHLEMLEVFRALRDDVIQSGDLDHAFGIYPRSKVVYRKKWKIKRYIAEKVHLKDDAFEARRKLKWTYYLNLAATRFHPWIRMVNLRLREGKEYDFLCVPPLDVLVVWHAFLLNPSDFADYCSREKLEHVQNIVFPWTLIHNCIDSNEWTYTLPPLHAEWLETHANMEPDLLSILSHCGRTQNPSRILLTRATSSRAEVRNSFDLPLAGRTDRPTLFVPTIVAAAKGESANRPLVENVERQCIFVDKMHAHRWIRSPAVRGTLTRAVDRYDNFLLLFRLYPGQFLVPTLDVDLVWHTHQCSAENYRRYVTERADRFINHDDKIGRGTLDDGFTLTEQSYRAQFGGQYQVCLCWDCEAILSAVEEQDDAHDEEGDIVDEVTPNVDALVREVEYKVAWYREVEIARKFKRDLPLRRN